MNKSRFIILASLFLMIVNSYSQQLTESFHWNKIRGYEQFAFATSEGIIINNRTDSLQYDYFILENPSNDFSLDFRAANRHGNPMKKYQYFTADGEKRNIRNPLWGVFITGLQDTIVITFKGSEINAGIESMPSLEISHYNGLSCFQTKNITKGVNPYDGDNIWNLRISNGKFMLKGGDHSLNEILSHELTIDSVTGFGFMASWGTELKISDINLTLTYNQPSVSDLLATEGLDSYFQSSDDNMEGYWVIFDRDLEETLLKPGGDYELACIKNGDAYYFLYLQGASVNRTEWNSGELKAVFNPTPFDGLFNVIWYDALKQPLSRDIKAQRGEGNTLTIQFPYQSSRLRLRKKP